MKITRATSFFSMSRNKVAGVSALLTCLALSPSAYGCGGEYQYWYHVSHPASYDPLKPRSSDSTFLYRQIFPQKAVVPNAYQARQQTLEDAYNAVGSALSQHRPHLFLLQPSKYNDFYNQECFVGKYRTLWQESASIMRSIEKRIERFDLEQNLPDGTSRGDYQPEYDHIPAPAALVFLQDLRTSGANDRYSSYFTSVRSSLTHCYADTANPSNWPAARQFLLHLQDIPEHETWSSLALLIGYVNDGSPRDARKILKQLSAGPGAPALEPLKEEVQYLVDQYEELLRDDSAIRHRPFFKLDLPTPSYGWGSCESNSLDSFQQFGIAAIEDKNLGDAEVEELLRYRAQLLGTCPHIHEPPEILSTLEADQKTPHHTYLLGAIYFYMRDYDRAQELFSRLAKKNVPWVSETSLYLVARSQMMASQSDWSGYYRDETIDRSLALESAKAFSRYVSDYPDGRYVDSARGLIRRAHWLAGDDSTYLDMLLKAKDAFLQGADGDSAWTVTEIDRLEKLFLEHNLRGGFHDPGNTLAVMEAFVGNRPVEGTEKFQPFSRAQAFIRANRAFGEGNYEYVIEKYGDRKGLNNAELLLLARSLEKQGQIATALDVWRNDLAAAGLPQWTIDYEVSRVLFRNYGVEAVVRDESISNVNVKRVYLGSLCDGELQARLINEALPEETKHAVFVDLAQRHLFTGNIEALHQLMDAQPDSVIGEYSAITTAARDIADGRSVGRGYMNIAYFLQAVVQTPLFGLEDYLVQEETEQCRQNTVAAGAYGPYYYFNKSLEFFDEDDQSVDEQKSLYYLTMCFKQGNSSRTCLWGDQPADGLSSKEAFTRLHAKYKNSDWANKARYHY